MSKLVVLTTIGVVGTGVSLTGAYMFGAFTGVDDSLKESKEEIEKIREINPAIAKTFSDFRASDGGDCAQTLFPGLKNMRDVKIIAGDTSGVDVGYLDKGKMEEMEGCLVVNWDRDEYKKNGETKWLGNFRFLWAVKQSDTKGFAVFAATNAKKDSKTNLIWEGVAYALSAEDNEGKKSGRIVKKKTIGKSRKTTKSSADVNFPKPNPQLASQNFWGFMQASGDIDRICGVKDCTGDFSSKFLKGYWSWEGRSGANDKLGEGTPNLAVFGKDIYNNEKWDMAEIVKGISGKWTNRVWKDNNQV